MEFTEHGPEGADENQPAATVENGHSATDQINRRKILGLAAVSTVGAGAAALLTAAPAHAAGTTNPAASVAMADTATVTYLVDKRITSSRPYGDTSQATGGRSIIGVFNNGQTLLGQNSYGLAQSDNGGATWFPRNVPTDAPASGSKAGKTAIVAFKGNYYFQTLKSSDGRPGIFRAAPVAGIGNFNWSGSLLNGATGSTIFSTAFDADSQYIYWGEYGDAVGGPSVYRSADGTTWQRVLGPGGFAARHVHGISVDPYNPGHVYMAVGDADSAGYNYRSTDYGATWAKLPGELGTSQAYQSCQISFDEASVWYASDTTAGMSVLRVDKATLTPRWHARHSHRHTAVPGGLASRKVRDLTMTSGSPVVTSASASFTADDAGSRLRTLGQDFIPIDTYIKSVDSGTQVTLFNSAKLTISGVSAIFGGEAWGVMAYYGAIDPATGVYYFVSINGGAGGNVDGLFACYPDGTTVLLDVLTTSPDSRIYIGSNRLWVQGFSRPLLTL
ncbi:WD40/YVTN/BNR-like repeat-containing protein [Pseudarthrobacter sp. TAF60_1]|uniref:WD40/YVTN/BNR-like repeat-containing protein n=1 Tax=Pseudarthrobacter sp. TAF60_1 TaxID=3233071 RepID=UPI003F9B45A0